MKLNARSMQVSICGNKKVKTEAHARSNESDIATTNFAPPLLNSNQAGPQSNSMIESITNPYQHHNFNPKFVSKALGAKN